MQHTYVPDAGLDSIADCYAMCAAGDTVYAYYYTEFPIVHVDRSGNRTHWESPIKGAHALAVSGPWALLLGAYPDENRANQHAERGYATLLRLPDGPRGVSAIVEGRFRIFKWIPPHTGWLFRRFFVSAEKMECFLPRRTDASFALVLKRQSLSQHLRQRASESKAGTGSSERESKAGTGSERCHGLEGMWMPGCPEGVIIHLTAKPTEPIIFKRLYVV